MLQRIVNKNKRVNDFIGNSQEDLDFPDYKSSYNYALILFVPNHIYECSNSDDCLKSEFPAVFDTNIKLYNKFDKQFGKIDFRYVSDQDTSFQKTKATYKNITAPVYALVMKESHPANTLGAAQVLTVFAPNTSYKKLDGVLSAIQDKMVWTDGDFEAAENYGNGGCSKIISFLGLPEWFCDFNKWLKYWWIPVALIAASQLYKMKSNE